MNAETLAHLARLMRGHRVAALGTLRPDGRPLVSMIAYAPEPDLGGILFLASGLAQHTQDFRNDPRVSLMIAEADQPDLDPQTLARLSISGDVAAIGPGDLSLAREEYLHRLPTAAPLFTLGDFVLYRITVASARFVAGFGQAYNLSRSHFLEASRF